MTDSQPGTKHPSASKRLRILFLVPFAPHLEASHGGSRVMAQLIDHLAQRHSIALCYLRAAGEPAIDNRLRERCDMIEEVLIPEAEASGVERWSRRLQVWKELIMGKPLWAIDRFSPLFGERVKTLLRTWRPDIVQIEFHIMGQYLSALSDYPAPRILVQHDPGEEAAREIMMSRFHFGRIIPQLDLLAWKRFEREITRQVHTVVVFTERDHQVVSKLGQPVPVVRIPFGTEIPKRSRNQAREEPLSLLFVGNFKHLPNVDAAQRLITVIFPMVQARFPESLLYIVGSNPPPQIERLASERVIVTGYVSDLTAYLDRAALFVVPLRMGGGMRVKILEALANGNVVVASSLAVQGIDVENGRQFVLADSDQEFSQAVIKLLDAPELRMSLARQARAWACEHLSWEKTVAAYEDLYDRLIRAHSASRLHPLEDRKSR